MKTMEWNKLLSPERVKFDGSISHLNSDNDIRGRFARDYDRVLFSTSFRRLADKTQVFPIPDNDHVHSRLTHSSEVASVGRSVAIAIGKYVIEKTPGLNEHYTEYDFGDIVAAACLAHDIGNPPFGHSGEYAIRSFFDNWLKSNGQQIEDERQKADLRNFDGNPQGFRIISRLQNENSGGLKLTVATLATFTKYPRASQCSASPKQSGKIYEKNGFYQSELGYFQTVANIVGLLPCHDDSTVYCRHPLAFVVEAADDVSNFILDLEDAWRLKYISTSDAVKLLEPIASLSPAEDPQSDDKGRIISLRARALRVLRREIVDAFKDNYDSIMNGTRKFSLIDGKEEPNSAIRSHAAITEIKQFSKKNIYSHSNVLKIELPGYQILRGLLEELLPVILTEPPNRSVHEEKLVKLFGIEDGRSYDKEQTIYARALRACDYVAGMTDSFAISQYQLIKGVKVDPTVK